MSSRCKEAMLFGGLLVLSPPALALMLLSFFELLDIADPLGLAAMLPE